MTVLLFHLLLLLFVAPFFSTISGYSSKLGSKHFYRDYFDSGICLQEATCIPLHNATCFNTVLPYTSTSIALAEDSISQFEIQDNLALWQGLRSVPRCWAVIQPLLCAIYMPKCENGSVFLPSQEMCRITRGPCRSVEAIRGWPPFLRCENKKLFPPSCRNPLQEVKFNTSYKCVPPLIETDNSANWYNEVEGCGLQCQNPFFTKDDHDGMHSLISVLASLTFGITTFTVATCMIKRKSYCKYPGIALVYMNFCMAVVSFGWLIQFFPGAREEIVCSRDGTIRRSQPRSGQHLCSFTFILIYYFLMASLVWFVILTYVWHAQYKCCGNSADIVKKKGGFFHIFAWCLPMVLTVIVMGMYKVDGDSMSGICFVGYADMTTRIVFLLVPVGVAALVGGFFMICTLYTLIKIKLTSGQVTNADMKEKMGNMILKIGILSGFAVIFIVSSFACHAYEFLNRKEWDESLKDYIVCLAVNSANSYSSMAEFSKCELKSKPSVAFVRINFLCLFGYGIIISLWIWNRHTITTWREYLMGLCQAAEKNESRRKDKMIAKGFRNKDDIRQGNYSFSCNSAFDDPMGMNLDIASIASRDISSSWAAAFPHFLERRNAITGPMPFISRQYSSASDMSRHISVDSFNQPNLDTLTISEQEYALALRHQKRKTRKERERYMRANRIAPWFPGSRRGSDTSLQSSLVTASMAAAVAKKSRYTPKVTKSTSTGDLGAIPLPTGSVAQPHVVMPPVNRRQFHRQPINPPFTHGMTDQLSSRVPSVASAVPNVNSGQSYTPNQYSVMPPSLVGMVRPPVYGGSYDVLNTVPYGYFNNGMYPPVGFFPGYAYNPEYMYNPYFPYGAYPSQYPQDILPMNPIADSASETEFFPIRLSDSEYTDTGMRSYDEQWITARRLMMQEHFEAQMAAQEAAARNASRLVASRSASALAAAQNASASAIARSASASVVARNAPRPAFTRNASTPIVAQNASGSVLPHNASRSMLSQNALGSVNAQKASGSVVAQNASKSVVASSTSKSIIAQCSSTPVVTNSDLQKKTQEDSKTGAKTKKQFFKKIWPFNTNYIPVEPLDPSSDLKSAHSEAPPSSPIGSAESSDEDESDKDEVDDVFIAPEETQEINKKISTISLPQTSETASANSMFYKIKANFTNTKFRRATSYISNLEKVDTIELTSRVCHSSLLQLSTSDPSVKNIEIKKKVLREKWLHSSEGVSLMNGNTSPEHISR